MISQPDCSFWLMVLSVVIWYLTKKYRKSAHCKGVYFAFGLTFSIWGAFVCGMLAGSDWVIHEIDRIGWYFPHIICCITFIFHSILFSSVYVEPKLIEMHTSFSVVFIWLHMILWIWSSIRYHTFFSIYIDQFRFDKDSLVEFEKLLDMNRYPDWLIRGLATAPNERSIKTLKAVADVLLPETTKKKDVAGKLYEQVASEEMSGVGMEDL